MKSIYVYRVVLLPLLLGALGSIALFKLDRLITRNYQVYIGSDCRGNKILIPADSLILERRKLNTQPVLTNFSAAEFAVRRICAELPNATQAPRLRALYVEQFLQREEIVEKSDREFYAHLMPAHRNSLIIGSTIFVLLLLFAILYSYEFKQLRPHLGQSAKMALSSYLYFIGLAIVCALFFVFIPLIVGSPIQNHQPVFDTLKIPFVSGAIVAYAVSLRKFILEDHETEPS